MKLFSSQPESTVSLEDKEEQQTEVLLSSYLSKDP